MTKPLVNAAKGLVGIVATAIITNVISGQPIAGLIKLEGLYKSFIKGSVPAWAFALAFLVAIFGAYYMVRHPPNKRHKGKVHFVPDAHNCGWAKRSGTQMDVRIGGTFTYEGKGSVMLLKVCLSGARPTTEMNAQAMAPDGSGRMLTASQIYLRAHTPIPAIIQVYVSPIVGTPGKTLRRRLVFRDTYNRDFVVGPIEFPYIGGPTG